MRNSQAEADLYFSSEEKDKGKKDSNESDFVRDLVDKDQPTEKRRKQFVWAPEDEEEEEEEADEDYDAEEDEDSGESEWSHTIHIQFISMTHAKHALPCTSIYLTLSFFGFDCIVVGIFNV